MGSLILPVQDEIKIKLILLAKYGLSTTAVVVNRNVNSQAMNLKSALCNNRFIKRNGRQPNCCVPCFEVHKSKIRFQLFKKMTPYAEAEDAVKSNKVSPIQVTALRSFLRINDKHHNSEGLDLKFRIMHFMTAVTTDLGKQMSLPNGAVPGLDSLILNFSNYFRDNADFRDSAFVGIMSALVTKISDKGINNPPWNDKALNLCMIMHDQCPKAYNVFMQNIVGVSDRHLRRLRGSSRDVQESVLELDEDMMMARLKHRLDLASNALISQQVDSTVAENTADEVCNAVAYSIAFDGTTVPPVVQTCPHVAGIVGMCAPNHIRRPVGDESIKTMLPELSRIPKEQLANEAMIAVISFQIPNKAMSPMALLAVQPQRVNSKSNFIQRVVNIALASSSSGTFLGYSGDGAHAAEIKKDQTRFLNGEINYLAQQDINHAMKNFLGALVGGTQLLTAAGDVVDNGLLRIAGVAKEIWCRKDFASDGLVLKATSYKTLSGVMLANNEECGSKAMLVLTLTFMRVFLFSIHGEVIDRKQRVIGIWASMLFLTSIKNLNPITKRNLMACAVGAVFAAYRADVVNMSAIFEEAAEHMFASMRNFFKMFTIADIPILDEKVQRRILALVEHGITSQASDQRSGGYATGTLAYTQRNARMLLRQKETVKNKRQRTDASTRMMRMQLPSEEYGGVEIDHCRLAAEQIAAELIPILSAVSRGMRGTMSHMGFRERELCAFMDPFLSLAEFTKLYSLAMNSRGGSTSSAVNDCLPDLFDNFLSLEDSEEEEVMAARAEAMTASTLIDEDECSLPSMEYFLNACLDINSMPAIHRGRGDPASLKWRLALAGMRACEVSTLGSRERGNASTEMHYQQLNVRWFGTSKGNGSGSMGIPPPQLDNLKRNVIFQLGDKIYRVLTVYAKMYNKWLEVESVPMSHLQKPANLYKVHARGLVEDVLSFSSAHRKFIPSADHNELLTTGHEIASGTIIGSL